MVEFGLQRKNMVESQVRPSDITDRRITAQMLAVSRERFVPAALAGLAYSDETLDFGNGAFMIAPRALAKLIQLADIDGGERVLVIGSAPAYAASIVANLARDVVALGADPGALSEGQAELKAQGIGNVEMRAGPLRDGWAAGAPYGAVVIEGAIEAVPEGIISQLATTARLVAIERKGGIGRALLVQKSGAVTDRRASFELSAPLLSDFAEERAVFAF